VGLLVAACRRGGRRVEIERRVAEQQTGAIAQYREARDPT